MKRLILILLVTVAALAGAATARADVNASVNVFAEAGANGGGATALNQGVAEGGSGTASASYLWPLAQPFPSPSSVSCPPTGCAERAGGATSSVDEAAGVLTGGAGASVLVGNAPDPNYGGDANVISDSTISDAITLSKPATVWIEGTVHGTVGAVNSAPLELLDPTAEVDLSLDFCCTFRYEMLRPLGGYDQQYTPDTNAGPTAIDDTFSVPVDLPAGRTSFSGELKSTERLLVDGSPGVVYAQNALFDDGTVTFHVRVPDDVVATSDSGLLPIVGGASAADTVAPTTAATQSPEPGWQDWSKGPVTVHLAATDTGGSGVESITYSASGAGALPATTVTGDSTDVVISAEGTTTLTYDATDEAGNVESPHTLTVDIDDTGPDVTATVSPAPNAAGWNNTPTTLTLHATDAASGVRSLTFNGVTADRDTVTIDFGSAADDGVKTFTYSAADNLGNVGPTKTVTVRFDDVAPVVTGPPDGVVYADATRPEGAFVDYTLGVQDNLDPSPVVRCNDPSGSLFPIGRTVVTCTATDLAGNVGTVTFAVGVRGAESQIDEELPIIGYDGIQATVDAAARAARYGNSRAACNILNAYLHQLVAFGIDPATVEDRTTVVQRVRVVLGCG